MKKRKILTTIVIMLFTCILAASATLAIYTSQVFQRSVVRNRDNDIIRFSSNRLYRATETSVIQKYYYPLSDGDKSMSFQVCNFDQTKNSVFNEKNIEYNIRFEIKKKSNETVYSLFKNEQSIEISDDSAQTESILQGGKRSVDTYTFNFGESDYNNIELSVIVTPVDLTVTQNKVLKAILIPMRYASVQGFNITSEYMDSLRGGPDEFDAYNLALTASGGEGTVLLTWKNKKLDIDPFFVSKYVTETVSDEVNTTVKFRMNSENERGSLVIRFYNHNSQKPDWTDWNDLPIEIVMEGSENES